ncbi:MAG: AAA-like domain-containing protein [Anaerolineae bacterium]
MRFFNTAGPVNCQDHYCLPPLQRFDLDTVMSLIGQKKYFLLHAPRQTGKTSCLLALMTHLNQGGIYRALYANIEAAQAVREDVTAGIAAVVQAIAERARMMLGETETNGLARAVLAQQGAATALQTFLSYWCEQSPRPTVLLLDEVDALVGDTLISLLRQLRTGYDTRPAHFPQSIVLCGVRDLQDYRIHSAREKTVITGGSAFNIKAESLRLGDFDRQEVETLLDQHTQETGQLFTTPARELVWDLTAGQPWLVNALAYEVTFKMPEGRVRTAAITAEMIEQAKEQIIERRDTHIDQLQHKLAEPRVRRVIEPLLAGEQAATHLPTDDVNYVYDLGLIRRDAGQIAVANRIYQEVIPRELTFSTQLMIDAQPAWYVLPDGRLDLSKLLAAFQQFFREQSEAWLEQFEYQEVGPQLLMQAFLQRIVNGGGRVEREYGLGRRRIDLLVIWPHPGGVQRSVIELKLLRQSPGQTLTNGLAQTWAYADTCAADEAHLVIFDRRPGRSWEKRIYHRDEIYQQRLITVWGV